MTTTKFLKYLFEYFNIIHKRHNKLYQFCQQVEEFIRPNQITYMRLRFIYRGKYIKASFLRFSIFVQSFPTHPMKILVSILFNFSDTDQRVRTSNIWADVRNFQISCRIYDTPSRFSFKFPRSKHVHFHRLLSAPPTFLLIFTEYIVKKKHDDLGTESPIK